MKLYQTCDRCPFDVFLDCLFEKDYERLIISGTPASLELEIAWQHIYAEYCDLTSEGNLTEHMTALQQANIALAKIELVEAINQNLKWYYSSDLVNILIDLQLKPGITLDDSFDEIAEKMKKVMVRAKKFVVDYQKYKKILDDLEAGEPMTRGVYEDFLTALSKHHGYPVKASDYTVARYVREVNNMKKELHKRAHTKTVR